MDWFREENCEEFGNYVVSEEDFVEGEVVLIEEPLLCFPLEPCAPDEPDFVCVGCFETLPEEFMTCNKCNQPICKHSCSQEMFHSQLECKLYAEKKIAPSKDTFRSIKFVRIFLSKTIFPKVYQRYQKMSSEFGIGGEKFVPHSNERAGVEWKFLTEVCHLSVTLEEVKRAWNALKINTFLISAGDASGKIHRGTVMFDFGCKLSHSCSPNMEWYLEKSITEEGIFRWHFRLYTTRKIVKGEILNIAYTSFGLDHGTEYRREAIASGLPFYCLCPRCKDATEEDTFFSATKCDSCPSGYLLPEDALSSGTCRWKCSKCSGVVDGVAVKEEMDGASEYIQDVINRPMTHESLDAVDAFIEENSGKSLHPNHYLIFQATVHWLVEGDFVDVLLEQSECSAHLFQAILQRYSRCVRLVSKFKPTMTTVELELSMVHAVAAFAFKSDDCSNINFDNPDLRAKLRFAQFLLKHLIRARFWMARQPSYLYADDQKETADELYSLWSIRCDRYAQDLLRYEDEVEEDTLLQLRFLFI